jgi:hypothetical protein
VAELERSLPRQPALDLGRQRRHHVLGHRRRRVDVLRLGHLGHGQLVLDGVLVLLERGGHEEDHFAVLDRRDPAHGETAAIAGAVDLVDDRRGDVAGAQEVGMQRVRAARLGHRRLRRRQGLADDLATEDVLGADVAALAAEQVVFQAFQREQLDQLGNDLLGSG